MANIRVKDLPNTNAANDNDEFIVDSSTSGTRRLSYSELKSEISTDFQGDVNTYKIATLASDNKLDPSQIPDTLSQGLNFVGVANSAGDLTSTTQGDFYVIQTAFGVYSVGDQAVYDGSAYTRVTDGTKQIAEGGTGATTLDAAKVNLEIANIGTSPQEVPLNQHLGSLAYQSAEAVSADKLEVESTTGTATTQALTVTDGSSTKFVVQEDGRVGIGASPSSYNANGDDLVVGDGVGNRGLSIATGNSSTGRIIFANASTPASIRGAISYVHGAEEMIFATNAGTQWTLNSSGNLVAAAGNGIDFGSAAAAGRTVESGLLDDYEEGSFTAEYVPQTGSFATMTMDFRLGRYTKVGNTVHFVIYMMTSNVDVTGASDSLIIRGLPFSAANHSGNYVPPVYVGDAVLWPNPYTPVGGYIYPNSTDIYLVRRSTSSSDTALLSASTMTTGAVPFANRIMVAGTYETA